jgi:TRAP-type C4-dicarboxylate transport system permease small subunit
VITRFLAALRRGAALISALMFAAVFLLFCYKIAARYLAGDEAAWTDEVTVILFVWVIFWTNAFVLGERQHITFDLLYLPMPPRTKRVMALLRALLIGGIFLMGLPGTLGYLLFLHRERTPVLGWRLDLVYSCFGLFMAAVIARTFWQAALLLGPRWRRHL